MGARLSPVGFQSTEAESPSHSTFTMRGGLGTSDWKIKELH